MGTETIQLREWTIYFDPPPIPVRNCDWHFVHKDFDGAPDAGDMRCGHGASVEDCVREIEFIEDMDRELSEDDDKISAMGLLRVREMIASQMLREAALNVRTDGTVQAWDFDKLNHAYSWARPLPASGIEAAEADETRSGSAVGESPVRDSGDAQSRDDQ